MTTALLEARVIERLRLLPRDRVEEVLDFIDFLAARESTRFLAGRLAESLAALDVMDLPTLADEDEIGHAGNHPGRERAGAALLRR